MSEDIVNTLREQNEFSGNEWFGAAADEIERLRAELVRNADEFRETITELRQRVETLTAQRDHAKRLRKALDEISKMKNDEPYSAQHAIDALEQQREAL